MGMETKTNKHRVTKGTKVIKKMHPKVTNLTPKTSNRAIIPSRKSLYVQKNLVHVVVSMAIILMIFPFYPIFASCGEPK